MGSVCSVCSLGKKQPPRTAGDGGAHGAVVAGMPSAATTDPDKKLQEAPQQPERPKVPHMFHEIVAKEKTASAAELLDQVCGPGILLAGETKKYWVDQEGSNCFVLFARALWITWGEDPRYWAWYPMKETGDSDTDIDVAELKRVCWLEIHGGMPVAHLTPGVTYEVTFQVMVKSRAYGWEPPVKLQLKWPDGKEQKSSVELQEKPWEQWLDLKVGEVTALHPEEGDMDISLSGSEGAEWKSGLLIKCIKILPKE